jgi:hypothetical protein
MMRDDLRDAERSAEAKVYAGERWWEDDAASVDIVPDVLQDD